MPPTRVCSDCSSTVNIRKSVCTCGHVFTPKMADLCTTPQYIYVARAGIWAIWLAFYFNYYGTVTGIIIKKPAHMRYMHLLIMYTF